MPVGGWVGVVMVVVVVMWFLVCRRCGRSACTGQSVVNEGERGGGRAAASARCPCCQRAGSRRHRHAVLQIHGQLSALWRVLRLVAVRL